MARMQTLDLKQGATLSRAGLLPEGALYPGGTWTAKCEAVTKTDPPVRFTLQATLTPPTAPATQYVVHLFAPAALTNTWPVGRLLCDVDFVDSAASPSAFVVSSTTFAINVIEDVTT